MSSQSKILSGFVRDEPELRYSIRQHLGHALCALEEMEEKNGHLEFNDALDREVLEAILSDRAVREGVNSQ